MMRRYFQLLIAIGAGVFLAGCFDLTIEEPLVDIGYEETYRYWPIGDPAPGVRDVELNRPERMQRQLFLCQKYMKALEEQYHQLKESRDPGEISLEEKVAELKDQNDRLQAQNEVLKKQNDTLKKELEKIRNI